MDFSSANLHVFLSQNGWEKLTKGSLSKQLGSLEHKKNGSGALPVLQNDSLVHLEEGHPGRAKKPCLAEHHVLAAHWCNLRFRCGNASARPRAHHETRHVQERTKERPRTRTTTQANGRTAVSKELFLLWCMGSTAKLCKQSRGLKMRSTYRE